MRLLPQYTATTQIVIVIKYVTGSTVAVYAERPKSGWKKNDHKNKYEIRVFNEEKRESRSTTRIQKLSLKRADNQQHCPTAM